MPEYPSLQKFLEAVEEYDTVQELKQIFPEDPLAQYDKQKHKAYDWLKYYSKCGLVALGKSDFEGGNWRYQFTLTERGVETLEAMTE